jgi:hypothetical protein
VLCLYYLYFPGRVAYVMYTVPDSGLWLPVIPGRQWSGDCLFRPYGWSFP